MGSFFSPQERKLQNVQSNKTLQWQLTCVKHALTSGHIEHNITHTATAATIIVNYVSIFFYKYCDNNTYWKT